VATVGESFGERLPPVYFRHMLEAWLNFTVVIFVQALLFIICAYYTKKLPDIPGVLWRGIPVGIALGLLFDCIVGRLFGLHSYTLGFGVFFLVLNAAFSYGLFVANILLLRRVTLFHFYIWIIVIVAVYETTNYFSRVWTWEFALTHIEFLIVLLVGYLVGAVLVATISHIFLGHRFFFIDNLFKKSNS